jgi:hypothetical protein
VNHQDSRGERFCFFLFLLMIAEFSVTVSFDCPSLLDSLDAI